MNPVPDKAAHHEQYAADEIAFLRKQVSDLNNKLKEAETLANIGLWEWHVVEDKVTWSDNTYRMFNIAKDSELSYQKIIEKIHPDDRAHHDQRTAEWMANGGGKPYEYRIIINDNEIRYFKAYGKVEMNEQQQPVRFFGAIQDITEQVVLQKKLEHSLTHVISDFVPICAWCRSIKDETSNQWLTVENYLQSKNKDIGLSHGICPTCKVKAEVELKKVVGQLEDYKNNK